MANIESGVSIYFDATRLVGRRHAHTPTGIDRVDIRYAKYLSEHKDVGDFQAGISHEDRFYVLPRELTSALLLHLEERWLNSVAAVSSSDVRPEIHLIDKALSDREFLKEIASQVPPSRVGRLYVNCSHSNISSEDFLNNVRDEITPNMAFYIHDIIPITHPEYVRAGDKETHVRRMLNIHSHSPSLIVNSHDTAKNLKEFYQSCGLECPHCEISIIGVEPSFFNSRHVNSDETPYFLMLGTIEPRKNHISILHIWRDMVERNIPNIPRLVIAGKRGWNCENVFSILDHCDSIRPYVIEVNNASDSEVLRYISGCKALLFPTFVEGWGMPLVEALAHGTPAIVSDIPCLRESGQGLPDYISPIDLSGWQERILSYCKEDSPERSAQIKRLESYSPPKWEDSYTYIDRVLDQMKQKSKPVAGNGQDKALKDCIENDALPFEDMVFVNWYEPQVDSKGRTYRWCGEHNTATIGFENLPASVQGLRLHTRNILGVEAGPDLFSITVNGALVHFEGEGQNSVQAITVDLRQVDVQDRLLLTFHLHARHRPSELGINTDKRLLSFNLLQATVLS